MSLTMREIPKPRLGGQRVRIRTLAQFHALPPRSQDALQNAAQVVTRMGEGVSLEPAAAQFGIDPRTVVRYAGSALRKDKLGRYVTKPADDLFRVLVSPVHGGLGEFGVRGSAAAHTLSERFAAHHLFLDPGDVSNVRTSRRKPLRDASGREIPLLTDLDELERLGDAGVLQFESIYARRA